MTAPSHSSLCNRAQFTTTDQGVLPCVHTISVPIKPMLHAPSEHGYDDEVSNLPFHASPTNIVGVHTTLNATSSATTLSAFSLGSNTFAQQRRAMTNALQATWQLSCSLLFLSSFNLQTHPSQNAARLSSANGSLSLLLAFASLNRWDSGLDAATPQIAPKLRAVLRSSRH